MAVFPILDYFAFNCQTGPVNQYLSEENKDSVYEVLRVIRGVPLFLTDHLKRLSQSAKLANLEIRYSEKEIEDSLSDLIQKNQVSEGNILISCKENLIAFFIPYKYPGQALYENGIRAGILRAERQNPGAKVFQTTVRQQADEMMLNDDFYEVLLVDQKERVTEGSRSNVFFVEQNKIITPPSNEVLLGVTRNKTILLSKELNINVEERSVYLTELASFNGVFVTGTSPKILPVKQIGEINFDPKDPLIRQVINAYDDLIEEYISGK